MRFISQATGGGVEALMIPSHPLNTNANPAAKRKTGEESEGALRNAKKARQESSSSSTNPKRKQEKLGGLVIVRGPPRLPSSQSDSQPSSSRAASSNPQQSDQASTFDPSSSNNNAQKRPPKPPSSSQLAERRKKGKERESPDTGNDDASPGAGAEQDVEEDVRWMNSEADDLRDRSRASIASMTPAAQRVQLEIPEPSTHDAASKTRIRQLQIHHKSGKSSRSKHGTPPPKGASKDILQPLPERDTPQIVKNRLMRGETGSKRMPSTLSNGTGSGVTEDVVNGGRRRSSLGRGKRISASFDTGIITRPHTSVSDSSLYKHIDPELPESQRMRQLLVWTASRSTHDPKGSKRRKSTSQSQSSLPPLPPGGEDVLRRVEEEVIKMLAEGRIETNVYSPPGETPRKANVKENEQNVKNRAREKLFTEQIEERKQEDIAWAEVAQFYNAHQQNVLASLHQRHRARTPSGTSKAKGKQRASSHEPDELDAEPWEGELPESMRKGYEVARLLLAAGVDGVGKSERGDDDLRFKEDLLHAAVSASHQFAAMASATLSHRFALLRLSQTQRTDPFSIPTSAPDPSALSNFVPFDSNPPASSSQPALPSRASAPDPQDLLRTISQADASRPRNKVGDTARRAARDVQRMEESYAAAAENSAGGGLAVPNHNQSQQYHRKLTDVPPPTPRKPPGTPRRSATPGAGRRA